MLSAVIILFIFGRPPAGQTPLALWVLSVISFEPKVRWIGLPVFFCFGHVHVLVLRALK